MSLVKKNKGRNIVKDIVSMKVWMMKFMVSFEDIVDVLMLEIVLAPAKDAVILAPRVPILKLVTLSLLWNQTNKFRQMEANTKLNQFQPFSCASRTSSALSWPGWSKE